MGSWAATSRDVVYAGAGTLLITNLADGTEVRLPRAQCRTATGQPGRSDSA